MKNTRTPILHSNPATGERIRWLLHADETGGELVRFEMWTAPGGGVQGTHVHPHSTESFEVLSGELILESGRGRMKPLAAAALVHRYSEEIQPP
jgi:quercetin dioxygenase-like cupin family protein